MICEINFISLFQYKTVEFGEYYELNGNRIRIREEFLYRIKNCLIVPDQLRSFLYEEKRIKAINEIPYGSVLIPVPKGSKSLDQHQVFPSLLIAESLRMIRSDLKINPLLYRSVALVKSKGKNLSTRSTIQEQLSSLGLRSKIVESDNLVLVDDVITMGNTFTGCYLLLRSQFENVNIQCVSLFNATQNYVSGQDSKTVLKGKMMVYNYNHARKAIISEIK